MTRWAFILYSDEDHTETKTLGVVSAANMGQAMRRGFFSFVAVGFNASDYCAIHFGGEWQDYPEAFFSVDEILDPEAYSRDLESEAQHFSPEPF